VDAIYLSEHGISELLKLGTVSEKVLESLRLKMVFPLIGSRNKQLRAFQNL
jgi:hypothetical protein